MSNQMIAYAYERKGVTSTPTPTESSIQVVLTNHQNITLFQNKPKDILSRDCYDFFDDNHEESTCEVNKIAQEKIFGKNIETTIVSLDWAREEDVMIVNTRNKSYANKGNSGNPKTTFPPISSSQDTNPQVAMTSRSQEVSTSLPPSKYNIIKKLANIKAYASLLDMVIVPEQKQHPKNYMEGKNSTIASLYENYDGDYSHVNKLGVNNFRNSVKYPPFYISVIIIDRIAHCCLTDGGFIPGVMSWKNWDSHVQMKIL
jgi:hypothetical protein